MAELRELSRTARVEALDEFIQRPKALNPRFMMGEGMMRDVVIRAMQRGASMLIFDQELTPAQIRSVSAMTELKVIDRSQLILDIFARRAKTLDGKVQVELAQLKYLLPRLTGRGVQMSRLMGGIGGRGPGETKLETDRRRIRDRIAANHKAEFIWDDKLVEAVLARCTEVDSGARNVDHILNGTLLPEIAEVVLARMAEGAAVERIKVGAGNSGEFKYAIK
jgi:hypothetical protein